MVSISNIHTSLFFGLLWCCVCQRLVAWWIECSLICPKQGWQIWFTIKKVLSFPCHGPCDTNQYIYIKTIPKPICGTKFRNLRAYLSEYKIVYVNGRSLYKFQSSSAFRRSKFTVRKLSMITVVFMVHYKIYTLFYQDKTNLPGIGKVIIIIRTKKHLCIKL